MHIIKVSLTRILTYLVVSYAVDIKSHGYEHETGGARLGLHSQQKQ